MATFFIIKTYHFFLRNRLCMFKNTKIYLDTCCYHWYGGKFKKYTSESAKIEGKWQGNIITIKDCQLRFRMYLTAVTSVKRSLLPIRLEQRSLIKIRNSNGSSLLPYGATMKSAIKNWENFLQMSIGKLVKKSRLNYEIGSGFLFLETIPKKMASWFHWILPM